jgi:hypothetical protein
MQNFLAFPEMSNSVGPPAEPEVYPFNYEKIVSERSLRGKLDHKRVLPDMLSTPTLPPWVSTISF